MNFVTIEELIKDGERREMFRAASKKYREELKQNPIEWELHKQRANNHNKEQRKNNPEFQKRERKSHSRWYEDNIESARESSNKWRLLTKTQVLLHYSNGVIQCSCCGELEIDFLTMDHVDNRKKWNHPKGFTGNRIYSWLKKNNYPEGFKVSCFNCNIARAYKRNNGICPHQKTKDKLLIVANERSIELK